MNERLKPKIRYYLTNMKERIQLKNKSLSFCRSCSHIYVIIINVLKKSQTRTTEPNLRLCRCTEVALAPEKHCHDDSYDDLNGRFEAGNSGGPERIEWTTDWTRAGKRRERPVATFDFRVRRIPDHLAAGPRVAIRLDSVSECESWLYLPPSYVASVREFLIHFMHQSCPSVSHPGSIATLTIRAHVHFKLDALTNQLPYLPFNRPKTCAAGVTVSLTG